MDRAYSLINGKKHLIQANGSKVSLMVMERSSMASTNIEDNSKRVDMMGMGNWYLRIKNSGVTQESSRRDFDKVGDVTDPNR